MSVCNIHDRHQMPFLMLLLNRHSNDIDTRHESSLMIESVLATQPEMNGHSYGCSAVSVHCRSDDRQLQARWCQRYFVCACNTSRSSKSICGRCLRASTKTFVKINVIHMDPVNVWSTTKFDEDHYLACHYRYELRWRQRRKADVRERHKTFWLPSVEDTIITRSMSM